MIKPVKLFAMQSFIRLTNNIIPMRMEGEVGLNKKRRKPNNSRSFEREVDDHSEVEGKAWPTEARSEVVAEVTEAEVPM